MNASSATVIHAAADALADYARDTFWRSDSGFHHSSRHSYEAAAAWLHEHAAGVDSYEFPDLIVHLFAPTATPDGEVLAFCGEADAVTTAVLIDRVTCGWCRVKNHAMTTATPATAHDERTSK